MTGTRIKFFRGGSYLRSNEGGEGKIKSRSKLRSGLWRQTVAGLRMRAG